MASPLLVCSSCDSVLPPGARYCPSCGNSTPTQLSDVGLIQRSSQITDEPTFRARLQQALGAQFVLGDVIGRGGFAAVYAARDTQLKRDVAVKVLRGDLVQSEALRRRFRREAEAVATLRHPHIVPIYAIGEGEGLAYYIMPLVRGRSLREALQPGTPWDPADACRILRDAAGALHEAHQAGIVHRDVKPENIMLEGDDHRVLLMDFGIAKALHTDGESVTGTGVFIGTPAYMSPEQVTGGRALGHRSDIYSLGVVGYEMLAGRPPFAGGSAQELLANQVATMPVPLVEVVPGLAATLSDTIGRCLRKKPEDRWETAAALRDACDEEVRRLTTSREMFLAEARRARRRRSALGIGGIAAVAAITAATWYAVRAPAATPPPSHRQLTFGGGTRMGAISPDGQRLAFVRNDSLMAQRLPDGEPVFWFTLAPIPMTWNGFGTKLLLNGGQAGLRAYPVIENGRFRYPQTMGPGAIPFALSRDGTRLARAVNQRIVVVEDLLTGVVFDSVFHRDSVVQWSRGLEWSPSGAWIAYTAELNDGSHIAGLIAGDASRVTVLVEDPVYELASPQWTPDGSAFYYAVGAGEVVHEIRRVSIDPRTGAARGDPVVVADGLSIEPWFNVTSDGRQLLTSRVQETSRLRLLTFAPGNPRVESDQPLRFPGELIRDPHISADGSVVTFTQGSGTRAEVALATSGSDARRLPEGLPRSERPRLSPDGRRIAFISAASGTPRVHVHDRVSGRTTPVGSQPVGQARQLPWMPDGRSLAYTLPGNRNLAIVDTESGEERRLLSDSLASTGWIFAVAFSPDGRHAVAHMNRREGGFVLIDIENQTLRGIGERNDIPLSWPERDRLYVLRRDSVFVTAPFSGRAMRLHAIIPRECLGPATTVAFTADGRRAVCEEYTRQADLWLTERFDQVRR